VSRYHHHLAKDRKTYPMTGRPVPSEFLDLGITSFSQFEAQCACRRVAEDKLLFTSEGETADSSGFRRWA